MKSHDLNALTRTIMERHSCTWREARGRIGRHGAAARTSNLRRAASDARRADLARERADRISP